MHQDNHTLGTPEEMELRWYHNVYQGDKMPQLTLRAVLMGAMLGSVMSVSNLYVGLKTGWGVGVSVTACILSFSIYKTLSKAFPRIFKTEMSILENNCMQSTASSAGYSTGSNLVSAVAAYLMITGHSIPWPVLMAWIFFLAVLGVFLAIPMKRQLINIEQLAFPSGIATAETLKNLYAKDGEALKKARALGIAGVVGAGIAWFRDAGRPFAIPHMLPLPGTLQGHPLVQWTFGFEISAIMLAAGAIIGLKVTTSMLLGGIINYGFLAPFVAQHGAIDAEQLSYREIMHWSTWVGASIMLSSGLMSFAMHWKTITRACSRVGVLCFKKKTHLAEDPLSQIEVPFSWFLTGILFGGMGVIWILYAFFGTTPWMGCLAVLLTFFLALVACRATGESDITPLGAMGKITQLTFGVIAPTNPVTNLMTAAATSGATASAADLLGDLKSGYLLGANPRQQFIAQFLGIFIGVLVSVPAFTILIPNASVLGTEQWPAPAAQVWAAVAQLLSNGLDALHPFARIGMWCGLTVGVLLVCLEHLLPTRLKRWAPSAMGIGLSMVVPFFNSFSMFLGALLAFLIHKKWPKLSDQYLIPVSSGLIAGESIIGVLIALLLVFGIL